MKEAKFNLCKPRICVNNLSHEMVALAPLLVTSVLLGLYAYLFLSENFLGLEPRGAVFEKPLRLGLS